MKFIKLLGLICLICFTFFYTEKIITVSTNQDEIMIKLKEVKDEYKKEPQNAIIDNDTIIPGKSGTEIDLENSYKEMKKIGYFEKSLIKYKTILPEISIYNNYDKYIINGNETKKEISLIYIINNDKTIDNILKIIKNKNTKISFFIDSTYLNNNINILNKLKDYEIYNYGDNGTYTKDNLIITNNIINNKTNNNSLFCIFLKKNKDSKETCANNKMLSIIPSISGHYNIIKNNIKNGNIINITNTKELTNIIDYIKNKGYNTVSLSEIISE